MTNWCDNKMTVGHSSSEMIWKAAEAFNRGELLDFFYPLPNSGWDYDWCRDNWGTKWDITNWGPEIDVDEAVKNKSFEVYFGTAWAPPIGAMERALQSGFSIKDYWYEDSAGVTGIWENGEDEVYDPSLYSTLEEARKQLPKDLREANDMFTAFHLERKKEALRQLCKPEDFEEVLAILNMR